ncbi:conserved hypothetical protein [Neospora caninum Liverpool]|uniref:Uncharacterized protein n=1 Tax=Neospora caninum (strain Liverpool) TaxID=572307 RepID=F0VBZ5_NEOCL|nr:conserved hypothetical protein [Neospora caninum Liverpool]CBZ51129.1 conserved hypothetical protein [Neospora caninum Liverpool]CEL68437.1 TPA: hypothetical protein BN1204_042040 [Neospora caninum Liverpool]|eukprot:XP_003881162.1 conserved hypothetical protein [Neospora caninum Liverpool]
MEICARRRHTDDEPLPLPSSFSSFAQQPSLAYPPDSPLVNCLPVCESSSSSSSASSSHASKRAAPIPPDRRRRSSTECRSSRRSSLSSGVADTENRQQVAATGAPQEQQTRRRSSLKRNRSSVEQSAFPGFDEPRGGADQVRDPIAQSSKRRRNSSESDISRAKRRKDKHTQASPGHASSASTPHAALLAKSQRQDDATHAGTLASSLVSASPSSCINLKDLGETTRQRRAGSDAPEKDPGSAVGDREPRSPRAHLASPLSSSRAPSSPLSRRISFSPRYSNFPALSPLVVRARHGVDESALGEKTAEVAGLPPFPVSLAASLPSPAENLNLSLTYDGKEATRPLSPTCARTSRRFTSSPAISASSASSALSSSSALSASSVLSASSLCLERCATCGCAVIFSPSQVSLAEEHPGSPLEAGGRRVEKRGNVNAKVPGNRERESSPESEDGGREGQDEESGKGMDGKKAWQREASRSEVRPSPPRVSSKPRTSPERNAHTDRQPFQCNACRSRVYIQSFFDDLRLLATGFHSDLRSLTRAVALSPQASFFLAGEETKRTVLLGRLGREQRNAESASSSSSSYCVLSSCRCPLCTRFLPSDEGGTGEGLVREKQKDEESETSRVQGRMNENPGSRLGEWEHLRPHSLQCLLRAAERQCSHLQDEVELLSLPERGCGGERDAEATRREAEREEGQEECSTHVTLHCLRGLLEAVHVANEMKIERLLQTLVEKGGPAALALSTRIEDLRTALPGFHTSAALLLAPSSRAVAPFASLAPPEMHGLPGKPERSLGSAERCAAPASFLNSVSSSAEEGSASRLSLVPASSPEGLSLSLFGEKDARLAHGAPHNSRVLQPCTLGVNAAQGRPASSFEACSPDALPSEERAVPSPPCREVHGEVPSAARKKRHSSNHSPGTRLFKSLGLSEATLRMLGPLSKQKGMVKDSQREPAPDPHVAAPVQPTVGQFVHDRLGGGVHTS